MTEEIYDGRMRSLNMASKESRKLQERATPTLCLTCKYRILAGRRESAKHVSHGVLEEHICLGFNPSAHPTSAHATSCGTAREEEACWSLKSCNLRRAKAGRKNRSPLVLEGLRRPCVPSMLPVKKKPLFSHVCLQMAEDSKVKDM